MILSVIVSVFVSDKGAISMKIPILHPAVFNYLINTDSFAPFLISVASSAMKTGTGDRARRLTTFSSIICAMACTISLDVASDL